MDCHRVTLGNLPAKIKASVPITNVVMMGMGEPLLNFENVDGLPWSLMKDDLGYGVVEKTGYPEHFRRCAEDVMKALVTVIDVASGGITACSQ